MQQQNIPVATSVDMYKRGELRLRKVQRRYVWRATRVRDRVPGGGLSADGERWIATKPNFLLPVLRQ